MNAKTVIVLLLLALVRVAIAEEKSPLVTDAKPRIAVLPFDDCTLPAPTLTITSAFSQRSAPAMKWAANQYGRLARGIIESHLTKWDEITTTDRQALDLLQREIELIKRRGADMTRITDAKKKAGVTHFLLGELLQLNQNAWTFKEYGLDHSNVVTTAYLRVRVVDVAEENVVFSADAVGRFEMARTQFSEDLHDDPGSEAVINAVNTMLKDPGFRPGLLRALGQRKAEQSTEVRSVEVVFDSVPNGASIEVGDLYVGSGRVVRRLNEHERFRVRISKPGFEPWTGTIVPEAGLVVAPELSPAPKAVE